MGLMEGSLHSIFDGKSPSTDDLHSTADLMLIQMLQALVRNTNVFASVCAGILPASRELVKFHITRNHLTFCFLLGLCGIDGHHPPRRRAREHPLHPRPEGGARLQAWLVCGGVPDDTMHSRKGPEEYTSHSGGRPTSHWTARRLEPGG